MSYFQPPPTDMGEPPTDRQIAPRKDLLSSRTASDSGKESRSQSLTGPEPDSGYEASPCSLADGSTNFFQSNLSPANNRRTNTAVHQDRQEEQEDLELDLEEEDYDPSSSSDDVFEDCGGSFVLLDDGDCSCGRRSVRRSCHACGTLYCDTDTSSQASAFQIIPRPSSLPIEIPSNSLMRPRNTGTHQESSDHLSPSPRYLPRTWPSTISTGWTLGASPSRMLFQAAIRRMTIAEVETLNAGATAAQTTASTSSTNYISSGYSGPASHDQPTDVICDSSASITEVTPSVLPERRSPLRGRSRTWTGDEDGRDMLNEDGNAMRDEGGRPSPVQPLPDLLPASASLHHPRNRSASVSLPLHERQQMYREVGSILRRVSQDFEAQRRPRRQSLGPRTPTLADITRFFRSP